MLDLSSAATLTGSAGSGLAKQPRTEQRRQRKEGQGRSEKTRTRTSRGTNGDARARPTANRASGRGGQTQQRTVVISETADIGSVRKPQRRPRCTGRQLRPRRCSDTAGSLPPVAQPACAHWTEPRGRHGCQKIGRHSQQRKSRTAAQPHHADRRSESRAVGQQLLACFTVPSCVRAAQPSPRSLRPRLQLRWLLA